MKVNGSISPTALSFEHRFDGMAEIRFRENIVETNDGYSYDEYLILMPYRDGLQKNIEDNMTTWLAYAKNQESIKLAQDIRETRDRLLVETNWTQMDDAPLSSDNKESMRQYRQKLRDITAQSGFPQKIAWPQKPIIESSGEHSDRLDFANEIGALGQTLSSLTTSNTQKNEQLEAIAQQLINMILV